MKPWLRKLSRILAVLLVAGVITGGFWVTRNCAVYTITSGSMEPLFTVGSRVVVVKGDNLQRNDVVAFHNPSTGKVTIHVFGGYAKDGSLITKGIANEDVDSFSPAPRQKDVIGRATYHTEAFTTAFWRSRRGIGAMVLFLALIPLAVLFRMVRRSDRTMKSGGVNPV